MVVEVTELPNGTVAVPEVPQASIITESGNKTSPSRAFVEKLRLNEFTWSRTRLQRVVHAAGQEKATPQVAGHVGSVGTNGKFIEPDLSTTKTTKGSFRVQEISRSAAPPPLATPPPETPPPFAEPPPAHVTVLVWQPASPRHTSIEIPGSHSLLASQQPEGQLLGLQSTKVRPQLKKSTETKIIELRTMVSLAADLVILAFLACRNTEIIRSFN